MSAVEWRGLRIPKHALDLKLSETNCGGFFIFSAILNLRNFQSFIMIISCYVNLISPTLSKNFCKTFTRFYPHKSNESYSKFGDFYDFHTNLTYKHSRKKNCANEFSIFLHFFYEDHCVKLSNVFSKPLVKTKSTKNQIKTRENLKFNFYD